MNTSSYVKYICVNFSLKDTVDEYDRIVAEMPQVLLPLMKPFMERVDEVLQPGVISLTWTSLNLDNCE